MSSKRALVVGASAGVGRALAEALAARGYDLVLSARDAADLDAVAADVRLRFGVECRVLPCDLSLPQFDAAEHSRAAFEGGPLDAALIAAGAAEEEADARPGDDAAALRLVCVNYLNAVRLLSALAPRLEAQGRGTLVAFSSIAAHAPRGRNMVYASAKAGLEAYVRALRHYLARTGKPVFAQAYALGYIDTAMTFGKTRLLPAASAAQAAEFVAQRLGYDAGVAFYPFWWRYVVALLGRVPWRLYRALDF